MMNSNLSYMKSHLDEQILASEASRPGGKLKFVVSYPTSERRELVAYRASEAALRAAE